jgi:OOP family OmpA-OmpF porin
MKRIILAAAVAASSNLALAAQPAPVTPFYVSVNAGSAKQEVTLDGYDGSGSASDTAFQIAGGYRVAPNIDVEVGYTNFGKAEGSEGNSSVSMKPQALHVAVAGTWRLTREFSFTGKLGVAHVRTKLDAAVGSMSGSDTDSRNTLLAGVGVRYAFTPNVAVTADYQHFGKVLSYNGINSKAHVITAGVRFSF